MTARHKVLLKKIGLRIKKLRGEASQDWLATKAGVSRSIVSGIEMGARDFQLSSLLRILDALQANISDVIDVMPGKQPNQTLDPAHELIHEQLQDLLDHGDAPADWISGNITTFHERYCDRGRR